MRKLRLRKAQHVVTAYPTWGSHSNLSGSKCLQSKTSRASLGERDVLPPVNQRSGDMGIYSQLWEEERGNWKGSSGFRRSPGYAALPLNMFLWAFLIMLKKTPSIFILPREVFLWNGCWVLSNAFLSSVVFPFWPINMMNYINRVPKIELSLLSSNIPYLAIVE